ncbi:MAG: hypothetical protein AAF708_11875 [Deinococcota bacterium]
MVVASKTDTDALTFTFDARTFQPNLPMWFIVVGDFWRSVSTSNCPEQLRVRPMGVEEGPLSMGGPILELLEYQHSLSEATPKRHLV